MVITKLTTLANRVESEKGLFCIFLLIKEYGLSNKWTIVVSANWLDNLSEKVALNYLIGQLNRVLDAEEIKLISRVSILKTTDSFVVQMSNSYKVSESAINIKEFRLNSITLDEVFIIKSQKLNIFLNSNRNPNINSRINPFLNSTINPTYNSTINPIYNSTINPVYNSTINPVYNSTINPVYNSTVNLIYNSTINPVYNTTLNPNFNFSINPSQNRNFQGLVIFDLSLNETGFIVKANEKVILIFNQNNNLQFTGVINNKQGYNIFNLNNEWVSYLVKADNIFLHFNLGNEWIGFVV